MNIIIFLLNTAFCSCIILSFLLVNYRNKKNVDIIQKKYFCRILLFIIFSLIFFIIRNLIKLFSFKFANNLILYLNTISFLFLLFSFYFMFVFIDYLLFKNHERSKTIISIVQIILIVHIVLLIFIYRKVLFVPFKFSEIIWFVDRDYLKSILCYLPIILMLCNFSSSRKSNMPFYGKIVASAALGTFVGLTANLLFKNAHLIYPCLTGVMLFHYMLLNKNNLQLDTLTGLRSKYSFNEFCSKLYKSRTDEKFNIIIIDIKHLKIINNILGRIEGNNAVKDAALIVKKHIRNSDFIARYSGEKFVLITSQQFAVEKLMARIQYAIDMHNERHLRPFSIQMSYFYEAVDTNKYKTVNDFILHIDQSILSIKNQICINEKIIQGTPA